VRLQQAPTQEILVEAKRRQRLARLRDSEYWYEYLDAVKDCWAAASRARDFAGEIEEESDFWDSLYYELDSFYDDLIERS